MAERGPALEGSFASPAKFSTRPWLPRIVKARNLCYNSPFGFGNLLTSASSRGKLSEEDAKLARVGSDR